MGKLAGSDEVSTISVRVDESMKESYKKALDDGVSMSEDIREYIKRKDPKVRGSEPLDERLSEAYRTLEENTDERNQIRTEAAKTLLANRLNIPKNLVQDMLLLPLENRGYIRPNWGKMIVRPRENEPD